MPVRKKSYWDRYPSVTLKSDVDSWKRKHQLFRGSNLKLALTTGIRNVSEFNIIKKILDERDKRR